MTDVVLELDGLVKRFGRRPVLNGISASVRRGDVIALLGLNGAGKTTLMETALGFAIPDEGTVRLFGEHASALRDESLKHRIGFVPQHDELIGALDGNTYLDMICGFYRHWNRDLLLRLTREWAVPLFRKVEEMSGGQRQKLSILAAIGHEPELLLLDEPVSSLDPVARRAFLRELIDIVSSGQRTVLFSTHLVSDVERVANRVWIVRDGRLIVDETLDELKESEVCRSATESFAPSGAVTGVSGRSLEDIFLELHQ